MLINGTTRVCAGSTPDNPHEVRYLNGWHHMAKAHWVDDPHKAAPKRYGGGMISPGGGAFPFRVIERDCSYIQKNAASEAGVNCPAELNKLEPTAASQ